LRLSFLRAFESNKGFFLLSFCSLSVVLSISTHVNEETEALLRSASGEARSFISWGFRFGGEEGVDDVDVDGNGGAIEILFAFFSLQLAFFSFCCLFLIHAA